MNPIYSTEENKIKSKINTLISSHNVLCDIMNVFDKNRIAHEYFESARYEVLESGNQSLSSMCVRAIDNMADDANENNKCDNDEVLTKIHSLERENRILKSKLESVMNVLNGGQ